MNTISSFVESCVNDAMREEETGKAYIGTVIVLGVLAYLLSSELLTVLIDKVKKVVA